jgi:hypothetical protein
VVPLICVVVPIRLARRVINKLGSMTEHVRSDDLQATSMHMLYTATHTPLGRSTLSF